MNKVQVRYSDYFAQTIQRMREDGLLLASMGTDGKANVMTIGWGTIGCIWSRPVFIVLVRPSRYTYSRLEQVSDFTVNVPPPELAAAASYCGSASGRQHDKFQEAQLTPIPSREVRSPVIKECVIHYECRTLHRNDLVPEALAQAVREEFYPKGDFHRVFFGEIVAVYADADANTRLAKREQGAGNRE
jgi:flavin reductase (DIM6/NTAB) family NADH-FMN oxidoreductase RutF